ncbi:MAG TPA: alpha-L-arabinofuranosidase C-terminal domain-containing protein [Puia sp.]|jgi:alpha-N-arabinofuranosidase|nr:alpha-L-arabinofuranosidase C-terminal domain-containing protein [Puia sp.]
MSKARMIFFVLTVLVFSGSAFAQQTATVTLEQTSSTVISKNIYGHFAEHLGRCIYDGFYKNGKIRMDIVEALKKIHVPVLRWPGGCFADQYHWADAIGPKDQRKKNVNTAWGMVTEDNSFGTHEFLQLCELIGCEPYIAGNVGTGSPQEMEDWIEYLNYDGGSTLANLRKTNGHAQPFHVAYWGIGNESWGCGGEMTPSYYSDEYKRYASFCMDYPGTTLKKIVSGANADDYNWTDTCMKNIPTDDMWGIGLHYYTLTDGWNHKGSATNFSEEQYFQSLKNCLKMEELIEKHSAILDKYDPKRNVALVVDEWGIWKDAEAGTNTAFLYQQNSLRDALLAASTLNIFNNHCERVKMANLAQTVNVLQALVLTNGDSMLLTPTYYVFDLFKVYQNTKWIPIKIVSPNYNFNSQNIPAVNASASLDSNNARHISLVNLDPKKNISVSIELNDLQYKNITAQALTSEKFDDVNTFGKPDMVIIHSFSDFKKDGKILTVNMPSKSVVVLELK